MGAFLETVYDVIFHPQRAMRLIADRRLAGQALFLFFISILMPPWTFHNAMEDNLGIFYLKFAACFAFWFFAAALLGFVAEMLGGRGSTVGLFAALGFSWLPRIVVMPLWALVSFLPEKFRAVAVGLIGSAVLIWIFLLSVEAVRASYNLSYFKSVIVLFSPILAMAGIVFVAMAFITGFAFMSLML